MVIGWTRWWLTHIWCEHRFQSVLLYNVKIFGRTTRIQICPIVLRGVDDILRSIKVTGQSRATVTEITPSELVSSQSEESYYILIRPSQTNINYI